LIKSIKEDSLTTEELIEKVATSHIRYTIADNALARLSKTYYKNLYISTAIGFPQHSYWLVRKDAPQLASAVDSWFSRHVRSRSYQAIYKRYFERSKGPSPYLTTGRCIGKDGRISPFDHLFKKYGERYQLDWRLLASIAYQESKFDPKAVSWAGAIGLMQLMPKTAGMLDVSLNSLLDPDMNIMTAARLFKRLDGKLRSAKNREQRTKMVLAGFNCGIGHVFDARALSRKYGKNPNRWDNGNVGHFIILKSQPKYYEDPVCKKGYLRGFETAEFVTDVWTRYQYYVSKGVK
ncbi:MAG: transglycosylase SLT domain-containing protein, partial [Bacteroidota bacterium]|nr:transglycosylase SLT domain-containing protein [Bacteroidota bacterium]